MNTIKTKKCARCEEERPITKYQEGRTVCRVCRYHQYKIYLVGYYAEHSKRIKKGKQAWFQKNKEKINKQKRDKYADDPQYRMSCILRSRARIGIKNAGGCPTKLEKTSTLVGCTWVDCCKYIESLFTEGMSWRNYGNEGWHIDHIRPISSFDLRRHSEQLQCFNRANLQPMWATENLSKGVKWKI